MKRFFWRTLLMTLGIVFGLSLALNVFFIVTGPLTPPLTEELTDTESASEPLIADRWGFGVIERSLVVREQELKDVRVRGVRSYTVPIEEIPPLRDELPLYRDQGIALDDTAVERLWDAVRAPAPFRAWALRPTLYGFESSNGRVHIILDPRTRILRIENALPAPEAQAEPIDDQTFVALASDELQTLQVDHTTLDDAVVERKGDGTVMVRFAKLWNLLPLLREDGSPVYGADVVLDEASGHIVSIRLHLLHPDSLSVSDYPVASTEALNIALQSGGVVKVPESLSGRLDDVTFTSFDQVYVVLEETSTSPTYVVPALRAEWTMEQTCSGCEPVLLSTYVPLIDEEQFVWR